MLADPSMSYASDYKGGVTYDEEEYSDEEYGEDPATFKTDGAPAPQSSYAGPQDVGFHPAQAYAKAPPPTYKGSQELVKPPGTPTGSAHLTGGQYVLDSKKQDGTDTFV